MIFRWYQAMTGYRVGAIAKRHRAAFRAVDRYPVLRGPSLLA